MPKARYVDGLKEAVITMLGDGSCGGDPTTFQNDMTTFKTRDDVLTLLVHLGYLAYDERDGEVSISNEEIAQEFVRAVKVGGWDGLMDALNRSEKLLYDTWKLDGEAVAAGVELIHSETASILKYSNEHSLACTILMAYYSDVHKPALVVELKWDKDVEGAIRQIKGKGYTDWIEGYTGEILLTGLSYEREKKAHRCVIEKYVKG